MAEETTQGLDMILMTIRKRGTTIMSRSMKQRVDIG